MARGKRKVVEKNYETLIVQKEKEIEKLVADTKSARVELRQLRKDKVKYDEQKEKEKEEAELRKVVELVANSGKSLEEIKEFLASGTNDKEE